MPIIKNIIAVAISDIHDSAWNLLKAYKICHVWSRNISCLTTNQSFERNSGLVMMAKIADGIFPSVNMIIINVNVKMILFSLAECFLSLFILLLIFWEVFVIKIGVFFFLDLATPFLYSAISSSFIVDLE